MERDNIIKALECCHSHSHKNCPECPYNKDTEKACFMLLMEHSLALITSQEQEIFELENRLKECENGYEGTLHLDRCKLHDAEQKIKELTEENERLKATKYMAYPDGRIEMIPTIESVKANTVREMQEQLKMEIGRFGREGCFVSKEVIFWFIDQIAKEMLEGNQ